MRRNFSWTESNTQKAMHVQRVIKELEGYLPLTLRQIYYRLVAAETIQNTRSQYNMLSMLVKNMRLAKRISWDSITDRTRRVTDKKGWTDKEEFMDAWADQVLSGYSRCLVQEQEKYIELWVEKDALSTVFERVAWPYCIRVVVCKGYQSVSFIRGYYERALKAMEKGQIPVILYFGDFDPSGVQMFKATQETLESDMGLFDVVYKRIALNYEDIIKHELPNNPDAVKKTDTRYKAFVNEYGAYAVELDAIHPATLKKIAVKAVEAELDMELFEQQKELEVYDIADVEAIRADVSEYIKKRMSA